MNIFISQPMRGRTDDEILRERKMIERFAQQHFIGEEIVILDSFIEHAPTIEHPMWYLGKSLEYLAQADMAIFAPGWQKARGCEIELLSCVLYHIPTCELEYCGGQLCVK